MKKFVNCAAVSFAIAILLSTPRVAWAGNEGGAGGNKWGNRIDGAQVT
ncbi:MAG: hypothetical protein NTV34_05550 [Proteobacteria bacterium]|nr:hypothetical protein [Pseudomonadota bacterium]